MRRAASLSNVFSASLIPLCIWGIVSALMIHLIAIRSIFVPGGEGRLRLAVLAFAGGVILLQRLIRTQGEERARAYAWAIGAAMTLFAIHNAFAYRLPVHPLIVLFFNLIIFAVLWWVAHKITAACSADSPEAIAAASESGSFRSLKFRLPRGARVEEPQTIDELSPPEEAEKRWAQKLPASHPGRILLYFSLFAVPAFGFGVYLFDETDPHRTRLGILLFIYLWCILALLFLSSLSQISNYFETRGVTLPESVGLTWLAIGFSLVTFVLLAAFFLPQPASVSSAYVRERMEVAYEGWEASRGFREESPDEGAPSAGEKDAGGGAADASAETKSRGSGGGDQSEGGAGREDAGDGKKERFETQREGDETTRGDAVSEPPDRRSRSRRARGEVSGIDRFFEGAMTVAIWVGAIAAGVVLIALVVAFLRGAAGSLAEFRFRRRKEKEKKKPGKEKDRTAPARALRRFGDPFSGPARLEDGDELIRYLWKATLAWCAEYGTPCEAGQTPSEFVAQKPEALRGFEEQARFLAGLVNFSEFSGQPVPESVRPRLHDYWKALQEHARSAA